MQATDSTVISMSDNLIWTDTTTLLLANNLLLAESKNSGGRDQVFMDSDFEPERIIKPICQNLSSSVLKWLIKWLINGKNSS